MDTPRNSHETVVSPGKLEFIWIEDDGLLRDEGVVFGLAGDSAALTYKETAIRSYFRRLAAESDRSRALLGKEIEALQNPEAFTAAVAGIVEANSPAAPAEGDAPGALVARYALGMLGALLMCMGTGVFVYEQLKPVFAAAGVITLGVVAAGLFTSFLPVSLLFVGDAERRSGEVELWKVRLAELGVPLVAAVFVVAWAWERLGIIRSAASAALLFMVFAFAGRQLLSSVPRAGEAIRALGWQRAMRRAVRDSQLGEARARAERAARGQQILDLQRQLARIPSAAEWDAACEAKLALFRSEYELATARAREIAAEPVLYSNAGSY